MKRNAYAEQKNMAERSMETKVCYDVERLEDEKDDGEKWMLQNALTLGLLGRQEKV